MKTRQEFLEHFFTRLRQAGFRVEPLPDGDLAAEVYAGNPLLCVVTRDGEIIYETYDRDNARTMTQAAEETRRAQDCHSEPPFPNMERMETVNLTGGAYYKVFESATVVLLCRRTELFGYEFVTCQKAVPKHNTRRFYRGQYFYDPVAAQESFMERSGLTLQSPPQFSHEELRLLVSCCTRAVCLDNELDTTDENRINSLMAKMEYYLPSEQELSPLHCFQNEPERGMTHEK